MVAYAAQLPPFNSASQFRGTSNCSGSTDLNRTPIRKFRRL
jgi:hypothetical protein